MSDPDRWVYAVVCVHCGARVGDLCRTATGKNASVAHAVRWKRPQPSAAPAPCPTCGR